MKRRSKRINICLCGCQRFCLGQYVQFHHLKHKSSATVEKIGNSRKGTPAWNKDLTKETDLRLAKAGQKISGIKGSSNLE